jgi:hypothetical protein
MVFVEFCFFFFFFFFFLFLTANIDIKGRLIFRNLWLIFRRPPNSIRLDNL